MSYKSVFTSINSSGSLFDPWRKECKEYIYKLCRYEAFFQKKAYDKRFRYIPSKRVNNLVKSLDRDDVSLYEKSMKGAPDLKDLVLEDLD